MGKRQQSAITFSGVSKCYTLISGEPKPALDQVNLDIPRGQIIVLVGPTGCGKTTLLNLVAGHVTPDQGEVILHDELTLGHNVSYVFQHYTLLPWLNISRNVALGLKLRGVNRRERKQAARDLLLQVGLGGNERALPHELSGGMRQRAAIAQAVATEPALLLMDEPFGALDEATRHTLQRMLIDLQAKRAMTVVFVTHNIDEALMLGDRVVVFGSQGNVLDSLSIDLPHPRDRMSQAFTEQFIYIRQQLSHDKVRD